MPDLNTKSIGTILATATANTQNGAGATTLFTVPTGKTCRVTGLIVYSPSASLAGGTLYNVTNWRQGFSLAAATATTNYIHVGGADLAAYTDRAAGNTIQFSVTTGTAGATTASIALLGYLT